MFRNQCHVEATITVFVSKDEHQRGKTCYVNQFQDDAAITMITVIIDLVTKRLTPTWNCWKKILFKFVSQQA